MNRDDQEPSAHSLDWGRRRVTQGIGAGLAAVVAGCLGPLGTTNENQLRFTNRAAELGIEYETRATGVGFGNTGTYVADYDNDHYPELLLVGGERPILYDNENGSFTPSYELDGVIEDDITIQSALFFDRNANGWEDLLLLPTAAAPIFLENVGGTYERRSVGLDVDLAVPTSATAADTTGNGYLDVFIAQMGDWSDHVPAGWGHRGEEPVTEDNGEANLLFINDGEELVYTPDAGIVGDHWSMATSFVDLTGDGTPDIHIANDFYPDVIYHNTGDGTFDRQELPAVTDRNGMSSLVADISGNGRPDIFVTNIYFPLDEVEVDEETRQRLRRHFEFVLQSPRVAGNNLIANEGDGSYEFRAEEFGVHNGGWGWAAIACDLDHDGHEELFHVTQNIFQLFEDGEYVRPQVFKRGDADTFEKQDAQALGFGIQNDRTVAMLDVGATGSMDIAIGAYDEQVRVYENSVQSVFPERSSIQLQLRRTSGALAIGSTVSLTAGGHTQHRFLTAASDYQSQSSRLLQFGLGDADRVEGIDITWPDGSETTLTDLEVDQRLVVTPAGIEEQRPYTDLGK